MRHAKHRCRCPFCHALETQRYGRTSGGHIRWYCTLCRHTFTPYDRQLTAQGTALYFDSEASYRGVGRALGINSNTAWNRIIDLGFNCKSPMEASLELKPKWSGFLLVDGDSMVVGKHRESLLLGVDAESQDIPHAILAENEDGLNWMRFLLGIKYPIGYPLKGIISDGDPAIQETIKAVFPGVPYQYCARHFEKELYRYLKYQLVQKRGYWREGERFLETSKKMLYAYDYKTARRYFLSIVRDRGFKEAGLDELIHKIRVNFKDLTRHHFYPGMPRTTNIAEGTISRLDSKINQADGYNSHDTAWATLKMHIMHRRFKAFTDCRNGNKENNGKSPLELAGVDVAAYNWITFSQKPRA